MKKTALMLMVGLLVIGLFGVVASAEEPPIPRNPEMAGEGVVALVGDATNALVFRVKPGFESECNVTPRTEDLISSAFVAQWAKWSMDFSGWEWYVRKPGTYYANCIKGTLQSNGDIQLLFDLVDMEGGNPDTHNTIATSYGYTVGCSNPPGVWYPATQMGQMYVGDGMALHRGLEWKLWNKIEVVECNSPGLYTGGGTITMVLVNQADWIDDEGGFDRAWFTTENGYLQTVYN